MSGLEGGSPFSCKRDQIQNIIDPEIMLFQNSFNKVKLDLTQVLIVSIDSHVSLLSEINLIRSPHNQFQHKSNLKMHP